MGRAVQRGAEKIYLYRVVHVFEKDLGESERGRLGSILQESPVASSKLDGYHSF